AGMIRRLGPVAWRRLHRLVYVIALLGLLHYFWLGEVGVRGPYYYALWVAPPLAGRLGGTPPPARARDRRGDPEAPVVARARRARRGRPARPPAARPRSPRGHRCVTVIFTSTGSP